MTNRRQILIDADEAQQPASAGCAACTGSPSFGPGCRVRVDSSSTYKGRYGTITEANGMTDRWFVAIDEDDQFAEVSFYARELVLIIPENAHVDAQIPAPTKPESITD